MDFVTFRTLITDEVSRGASLDALIAARVNHAIKWLEQNYNFQYMHRYVEFSLAATTRSVSLPSRPKRFEFVRDISNLDNLLQITKVEPQDLTAISSGAPVGYWLDAFDFLWFDSISDEAIPMDMLYFQYSAELSADGDTHWLIDNAQSLLVYQTMLNMALLAKQPEWIKLYKPQRDEALSTLIHSEEELFQGGQDPRMIYSGGTNG